MKKEFDKFPEAFGGQEFFGFSWLEYTAAVPSPLVVVTGYKSNGMPNATMQSWCCLLYTSDAADEMRAV